MRGRRLSLIAGPEGCRRSRLGVVLRRSSTRIPLLITRGTGESTTTRRSGKTATLGRGGSPLSRRASAGSSRCPSKRSSGRGTAANAGASPGVLPPGEQPRGEQLQAHARRNRAGHIAQRRIDNVCHRSQHWQTERRRLPMQVPHVLALGGVAQHRFGAVSRQRQHQQIAHARQQILDEPPRIEAADHNLLNHPVQGFAVAVDHRVDRLADQGLRRESKQRHRGIVRDHTVHGPDHQLVKHGKRIAHRAATGAHRELEHAGLRLDALLLADRFQIRPHHLGGHQAERIMVGARANRADHLVRFGRREDEHDVFRRLLNNLEQRVEALLRDHVGLVENEDLVSVAGRREPCALAQLAGIVDAVVRRRVDLDHVDRPRASGGQILAAFALAARVRGRALDAVDAAGKDAGGAGLAAAARPGKQVGMREFALVERAHQRDRDLILPDDPFEGVRSITSIQCKCHRLQPTPTRQPGRRACRTGPRTKSTLNETKPPPRGCPLPRVIISKKDQPQNGRNLSLRTSLPRRHRHPAAATSHRQPPRRQTSLLAAGTSRQEHL